MSFWPFHCHVSGIRCSAPGNRHVTFFAMLARTVNRFICSPHREHLPTCKCSELGTKLSKQGGIDTLVVEHPDPSAPVILYCHGSRRNICSCTHMIDLLKGMGTVVLMDYEGFGKSRDSDTMYSGQAMTTDVVMVLQDIGLRFGFDRRIFVYGHSLGAAIVALASARCSFPVTAYIFEGLFHTPSSVCPWYFGGSWVPWLVGVDAQYPVATLIAAIDKPILLIHSQDDAVVPVEECEKIRRILVAERHRYAFQHYIRGPHNKPDYNDRYKEAVAKFIANPNKM